MVAEKKIDEKNLPLRKIRSYVKREGRMCITHQRLLEHSWSEYGLTIAQGPLDKLAVFGRDAPCILEIGFGNGDSLVNLAQTYPAFDFVGIEVHTPGVGALIAKVQALQLTNVRVYREDAVKVLHDCLSDESLLGVLLFFPDPWPKLRHHKRRLVQSAFVDLVVNKLQPEGYFNLATDWQDYAKQMNAVLSANPRLSAQAETVFLAARPETKYERRGKHLGHGVWDFLFKKIPCDGVESAIAAVLSANCCPS